MEEILFTLQRLKRKPGTVMRLISSLLLAVFISVQSLLPRLSVIELTKLPALLNHYKLHRNINSEITFLSFLELHYSNPSHHDQDHQEHHKLPFTDHHSTISPACFYCISDRNYTLAVRYFSISQTNGSVYCTIVEEDISTHVWQPPRNS